MYAVIEGLFGSDGGAWSEWVEDREKKDMQKGREERGREGDESET